MTDAEIIGEFWAHRFYEVIKKGRIPDVEEFDTEEVDAVIQGWAEEDEEAAEVKRLKGNPDDWEEIPLNG